MRRRRTRSSYEDGCRRNRAASENCGSRRASTRASTDEPSRAPPCPGCRRPVPRRPGASPGPLKPMSSVRASDALIIHGRFLELINPAILPQRPRTEPPARSTSARMLGSSGSSDASRRANSSACERLPSVELPAGESPKCIPVVGLVHEHLSAAPGLLPDADRRLRGRLHRHNRNEPRQAPVPPPSSIPASAESARPVRTSRRPRAWCRAAASGLVSRSRSQDRLRIGLLHPGPGAGPPG